MLIYWEMTRACDLACMHCRAEAAVNRDPDELSTDEARSLLRQVLDFGRPLPHMVFTGGDPLKRPDLFDLIAEAVTLGIGVSLAPSATALLTPEAIRGLKSSGIQSMSLSLDGSASERHDAFRGVPGCFETTRRAAEETIAEGIPLQINTLVTEGTASDLPAIYDLMTTLAIERWSLFFLISVGRGAGLRELSPPAAELLMHRLYDQMRNAPFAIKTTEAPQFRRVALSKMRAAGMDGAQIRQSGVGRGFGIRDGNGIMFVSRRGDVTPSGFLPLPGGNVRRSSLVDIYRRSALFTSLRDVSSFEGRCGRCEFAAICGGSRARAFAHTGNPLASDPLCPYVPPPDPDRIARAA
jgi:radical SAM protein